MRIHQLARLPAFLRHATLRALTRCHQQNQWTQDITLLGLHAAKITLDTHELHLRLPLTTLNFILSRGALTAADAAYLALEEYATTPRNLRDLYLSVHLPPGDSALLTVPAQMETGHVDAYYDTEQVMITARGVPPTQGRTVIINRKRGTIINAAPWGRAC